MTFPVLRYCQVSWLELYPRISEVEDSREAIMLRVGVVGLGRMGAGMALNIAKAGFPLSLYDVEEGRTHELREIWVKENHLPAGKNFLCCAIKLVWHIATCLFFLCVRLSAKMCFKGHTIYIVAAYA